MAVDTGSGVRFVCYPYVADRRGRIHRGADLPAGASGLVCLGCGGAVNSGDGGFGHPVDGAERCHGDAALREAGRLAVMDGFLRAVESGGEYWLWSRCSGCGAAVNRVETAWSGYEVRLGEGGDVVFRGDRGTVVVEVVAASRSREVQSGMLVDMAAVPVYRVVVDDFRCVEALRAGVVAGGGLCLDSVCPQCAEERRVVREERARREEEERGRRRDWLAGRDREIREAARGRVREIVRSPGAGVMFAPWTELRSGRRMDAAGQRRAFANAVVLTECGFEQCNPEKGYLFRRFLGAGVSAYADVGPGGVGLYLMGMEPEEAGLRDVIRGEIERRLRGAGVDLGGSGDEERGGATSVVDMDLVELLVGGDDGWAGGGGCQEVDSIGRWRGGTALASPGRG